VSATATPNRRDRALWVQCACTALVAMCAAYVSYRHGREFAVRFGADEATATGTSGWSSAPAASRARIPPSRARRNRARGVSAALMWDTKDSR
jgi:hypothetical protein